MTTIEQLIEMGGNDERTVHLSHDPDLGFLCEVYECRLGDKGWLAGPAMAPTFEASVANAYTTFQRSMRAFHADDPLVLQWDGGAT